jgi:SAM-dependent methyltransferase
MPPPEPNFDRIARIYRWAEYASLGPLLLRTRNHFLPQITHCRRALVLGDGDGRFTAKLLDTAAGVHILAVDISESMLKLLRQRWERHANHSPLERLRTLQASALEVAASRDPQFTNPDLIVTHFFLDCLTQPEVETLARNLAQTASGTLWLLSDFGEPRPRALRPLAALYIRTLYVAFRILTGLRTTHLPDPQAALAAAGFERVARHERLFGLVYTELWRRQ